MELLVSVVLLATLMLLLSAVTESASRAWREGSNRTDTFQAARTVLELASRELAPAVVDTRTQFVIGPASLLADVVRNGNPALAGTFAPESPCLLWMAPIGHDGGLRCVGYYLYRDVVRNAYSLKRLYIEPSEPGKLSPYFPRTYAKRGVLESALRTSPKDAKWFTSRPKNTDDPDDPVFPWDAAAFDDENPENSAAVVSTAADGVIAFWVQAIDLLGNPVPLLSKADNHPKSKLFYNSAAYFQVATTTPFEKGSFVYLQETGQSMKANRVPSAVELSIVTIDNATLARRPVIPEQPNVPDKTTGKFLDVSASIAEFQAALHTNGIFNARVFSSRVRLINGN